MFKFKLLVLLPGAYVTPRVPKKINNKTLMHRTINGQAVQVVRRVCQLMTEHNERLGAGLLRAFDDETTSEATRRRPHGRERG